jgi:BMFP domain-containing protein YqiC
MGVAQGARTEAETALKGMVDRFLADRDLVTRDEFDAARGMAQKAREENDALRTEIEALAERVKALEAVARKAKKVSPE